MRPHAHYSVVRHRTIKAYVRAFRLFGGHSAFPPIALTNTQAQAHTHIYSHTNTHTYTYIHTHIHTHTHTHTHTHAHTHTLTYSPDSFTRCTPLHVPQALQIKDPAFVVPETRMAAEYLFAKAENDVKKRKGMIF